MIRVFEGQKVVYFCKKNVSFFIRSKIYSPLMVKLCEPRDDEYRKNRHYQTTPPINNPQLLASETQKSKLLTRGMCWCYWRRLESREVVYTK